MPLEEHIFHFLIFCSNPVSKSHCADWRITQKSTGETLLLIGLEQFIKKWKSSLQWAFKINLN
jgi:hypothetical protein